MSSLLGVLILVVSGQVAYHLLMRGVAGTVSPFLLVAVAYATGFVIVATIYIIGREGIQQTRLDWYVVSRGAAIGLAVACVEVGYVVAYRRGLPINTGALSVLAITTLVLVPIGSIAFDETLTAKNLLGAMLALVGVWLVRS